MKKIPTLFKRTEDMRGVVNEVTPGCEWVQAGEGVATRKFDGICVLVRGGLVFKRRGHKDGQKAPDDFEEVAYDPVTTKHFGWVPMDPHANADRWHREAVENAQAARLWPLPDGTYELVGPKINGNPERYPSREFVRHGTFLLNDCPRSYDGLALWLPLLGYEGVVFHHPDGRMAKLKRRDFSRTERNR